VVVEGINHQFAIDTTIIMGLKAVFVASVLAAAGAAMPILNPLQMMEAVGPEAGKVITKCSSPGQLALAYDDGPYQYTQKLVDTLTAGGAKGTFFVTGTLYGIDPTSSFAALHRRTPIIALILTGDQ
jgi:peptidoglycan/xylan/chitin deacetylase (PgdA/CDA1 family)